MRCKIICPFCGKAVSQDPPARAARQVKSDEAVGPGRKRRNHPANNACALKETTTAWGADCVIHDVIQTVETDPASSFARPIA